MCSRLLILPLIVGIAVLLHQTESAPLVAKYQELPHIPGYVPVYIQKGDTPLEEINLDLAEAFRSVEKKAEHWKTLEEKLDYILPDVASNATKDNIENVLSSSEQINETHKKTHFDSTR